MDDSPRVAHALADPVGLWLVSTAIGRQIGPLLLGALAVAAPYPIPPRAARRDVTAK
jgi:hypothetical protein